MKALVALIRLKCHGLHAEVENIDFSCQVGTCCLPFLYVVLVKDCIDVRVNLS